MDEASSGRKPWRYYYVMAFPLESSGVAQDLLQEMTEVTAAIEQREEEYLRKVAAKNTAHVAALEAERRAAEGIKTPTMASHVAWVLRRLYVISAVLLLLAVAAMYVLYLRNNGREHIPQALVVAAAISVVFLLVVNIGGWVAAHRGSVNGARVLLVISVVLIIGLALALDEVIIVRRSHHKLRDALASSEESLTQESIALILNGGTVPSLVQRFVFDAPSVFLQWLSARCSGSSPAKLGYASVAIDRREFFSQFWNDSEKACVDGALRICVHVIEIIEPILIGELVMVSLQVLFTGVFLVVCNPVVSVKTSKRRRQLSLPKAKTPSLASSSNLSTMLSRLLIFGAALFGSLNAIASTDLLEFCSIADFHALFTWISVLCLLSGLATMFAALFVSCGWKQQLAGVLLVVAVASEVFMLVEFIKMATRLIEPGITTESKQVQELREMYIKASEQTCSLIEHWISHICVGMSSSEDPAEFNLSCQHEFVSLLIKSFIFAKAYLSWSIGVKLLLLVQLILPALHQAVVNVVSYMCCVSPRDDLKEEKMESILPQSSPPLDYDEAVEVYLRSLKVRDKARVDAEREAFEKEWSARTGRLLSDVRTPRIVVTASDFGAIVRTLMLRRLSTVCKLDVSLSVSDSGQLLLVRIFASDNLLLATLCEAERYRLQFADAIDPGRLFWRNRQEVRADQKILDANTVKHKLKVLQAENAMPSKEAAWFPGESIARVSARIHALSRISRASRGLIRCCNPAPAFARYSPNIQRQFIYKKYPNKLDIPETYRRSAVLRTVDCIRVTRRIINAEFDINATIASGLVSYFHCLHSSSRFDLNSRGALASSWVTFWRPVRLPGEFYPEDHAILNLIGRIDPFRQPLQDVRDYFGELIGFYFAWLGFYAKMMILPAFITVVVLASEAQHSLVTVLWDFYISQHVSEGADKIGVSISLPELGLGLTMIAWSFVLIKLWERRSVWYQLQWGIGSSGTVNDANSPHHISGNNVVHKPSIFSRIVSFRRRLGSWLCILVLGGANLLVVLTMLLTQGILVDIWGEKLAVLSSCVCQAVLVQWSSACISSVAHALTRWENVHNFTDHLLYRSSVVAKMFSLHLLNTFTGLILLMLSAVGGLAILIRIVPPLRPLYDSYNARIEGHVGIFIRLGTQLIVLFAVQLCIRIFLILSAIRRFGMIQRREKRYSRKEYEDETMLSYYPGPDKDYAQLVLQFGLVVTFSSVCPLLPLLALIDCAVKLRQNALELCCIRQRPEPKGVKGQTGDDNDVGLGPWEPCIFLMVKLSVPVVLALALFTANNYDDISTERRVGYWLIGVLGIWLITQLLWFLIPRESRHVDEARARNDFLVERYFGHVEVHEQKTPPKHSSDKHADKIDVNIQEPAPSVEQSLHHYEERLDLLQRLNVALRKRDDLGGPATFATAKMNTSTPSDQDIDQDAEDEALQRKSESSEEMIVGYFRPVRSVWSPHAQREEIAKEGDDMMVEEIKTGDDTIATGVESGGNTESTGRPAPMVLSKLFKRIPPSSSTVDPLRMSDEADAPLILHPTPFVPADSSIPQVDVDPGVFAPTETVTAGSHDDELLTSSSAAEEVSVSTVPGTRQPRLNFLSRKFRPSSSKASDSEESKGDSFVVPDPPAPRRLSKFFKRAQPPSTTTIAPPSEPSPPVVTNVSAFERTEVADRTVNPVHSLRDQFDFLSDTHAETTSLSMQRRRSSESKVRPPSPPPVYTKIDLSGLEAVREAASRRQFDFSADEQVWKD